MAAPAHKKWQEFFSLRLSTCFQMKCSKIRLIQADTVVFFSLAIVFMAHNKTKVLQTSDATNIRAQMIYSNMNASIILTPYISYLAISIYTFNSPNEANIMR